MKFNSRAITLALPICILLFCYSTSASAQPDLISAIDKEIIPLKTLSPTDDFSDLQPVGTLLKNKRIVSLGEATHGTSEFFLFKHRLLKYFVTELGFKTFVIEADFVGSQAMNDYVVNGKGTAYHALQQMSIGVWITNEFVNMVEWIKLYNSDKAMEDKVKFFGCDMQFGYNSGTFIKK